MDADQRDVFEKYPVGSEYAVKGIKAKLLVYSGTTVLRGELTVPKDAKPGALTLAFETQVQACTDRECLAPEKLPLILSLTVTSAEEVKKEAPRHGAIFNETKDEAAPK